MANLLQQIQEQRQRQINAQNKANQLRSQLENKLRPLRERIRQTQGGRKAVAQARFDRESQRLRLEIESLERESRIAQERKNELRAQMDKGPQSSRALDIQKQKKLNTQIKSTSNQQNLNLKYSPAQLEQLKQQARRNLSVGVLREKGYTMEQISDIGKLRSLIPQNQLGEVITKEKYLNKLDRAIKSNKTIKELRDEGYTMSEISEIGKIKATEKKKNNYITNLKGKKPSFRGLREAGFTNREATDYLKSYQIEQAGRSGKDGDVSQLVQLLEKEKGFSLSDPKLREFFKKRPNAIIDSTSLKEIKNIQAENTFKQAELIAGQSLKRPTTTGEARALELFINARTPFIPTSQNVVGRELQILLKTARGDISQSLKLVKEGLKSLKSKFKQNNIKVTPEDSAKMLKLMAKEGNNLTITGVKAIVNDVYNDKTKQLNLVPVKATGSAKKAIIELTPFVNQRARSGLKKLFNGESLTQDEIITLGLDIFSLVPLVKVLGTTARLGVRLEIASVRGTLPASKVLQNQRKFSRLPEGKAKALIKVGG